MSAGEPAVVVQRAYDWALWVMPKAEKFPKSYRFTLGDSLVRSSIELLLHVVDATYQSHNAASLGAAAREVNRIRYLVRLAKDLRVINIDSHEFAAKTLDEIGRMTGGWLKGARRDVDKSCETRRQSSARLTAWQNLLECARLAALGKRKRPDVAC